MALPADCHPLIRKLYDTPSTDFVNFQYLAEQASKLKGQFYDDALSHIRMSEHSFRKDWREIEGYIKLATRVQNAPPDNYPM